MKFTEIKKFEDELQEINDLLTEVGHIIVAHLKHDFYVVQFRADTKSCVSALIKFTGCEETHFDGQCEYKTASVEVNNILIGNVAGHSEIDDFYVIDGSEDSEDDEDFEDKVAWVLSAPEGFKAMSPDYLESSVSLKENPDKISVIYHSVDDILHNIALNIIRLQPIVFGERFEKFLKNCVRIFDFNEYPVPDVLKFDSDQEDTHYFITTSFSDDNAKVSGSGKYWETFYRETQYKVDQHFDNVYFGFDPAELCVKGVVASDEFEHELCLETLPAIYCTKSYQEAIETFVEKEYALLIIDDNMWVLVGTSLSGFGYNTKKGQDMFEFDLSKKQREFTQSKLVSNWNVGGK